MVSPLAAYPHAPLDYFLKYDDGCHIVIAAILNENAIPFEGEGCQLKDD